MPNAINRRGNITGSTYKLFRGYGSGRGFVRGVAGAVAILSFADFETFTLGINASHTICGYYGDFQVGFHGLFLTDGVYTSYDVLAGGNTALTGINDAGDVAGDYGASQAPNVPFFTRGGTVIPIDLGFAPAYTIASGISSDGRVVGCYILDPYGVTYSFIRQADGTIISGIRDPDAVSATCGNGVNARGWVVGYCDAETSTPPFGFLYLAPHKFINYNYPGASETYLTGINDQGRICGYYRTSDDAYHAMILQVVE